MPELPEVETTRRGIATVMNGQTLKEFIVHESRMRWPIPADLPELINKQTVLACERRGKYLLLRFAHGTQLIHLGMSGSLRRVPLDAPRIKHDHAEWVFEEARFLLHDPRRFGSVLWHSASSGELLDHPLLSRLGVEPFSEAFTPQHLYEGLQKRKLAVKPTLMGGDIVVGVGNIYASEALFRAGIHPEAPASSLSFARVKRLHQHIVLTLQEALDSGGSTLRDYVNATGEPGAYFELHARVYDKLGLPCPKCGRSIKRIVQSQRATYFCSACQRR
ncbi:bifunctional DNA-formamidopyrimidine glycosylase/DNA-(apurinic or apyrimidinic site) lyase [Paenalcaligenes niemegkensis]|uniref:bifunctional DNA-formamidopyrimidine glycosylase/DNA-(apurinic or apyrimidinic site) lyase n=1 Tax=Paenalcaligenes niemegkensis TaxID=2895469 RepID=UPI001EE8CA53|nr:bifunctional DNA-formamidopyrimidine glycosylase/DNA-(apurinic or apyrimidinic site) lyase [Paenalcaligenes niemegkensis]MCQ9617236.1 bifunctional DNA-formamidopyrimidine glycosylase/DNA-(apurinic or apyrimidinic site) lyase [Paenalcaligenes niemegkensis]